MESGRRKGRNGSRKRSSFQEAELPLNTYADEPLPNVPVCLRDAAKLFAGSELARNAFGNEVVEHYVHAAKFEVRVFDASLFLPSRLPN